MRARLGKVSFEGYHMSMLEKDTFPSALFLIQSDQCVSEIFVFCDSCFANFMS